MEKMNEKALKRIKDGDGPQVESKVRNKKNKKRKIVIQKIQIDLPHFILLPYLIEKAKTETTTARKLTSSTKIEIHAFRTSL